MEGWIALVLVALLGMAGVYDVVVSFRQNGNETVSSVIYRWCRNWPFLAAALGGLVVHLIGLAPTQHHDP